jgi:hypothetical protein
MTLHSKLPKVGTTIFSQMSQLAARHQAINLSQGFPDFRLEIRDFWGSRRFSGISSFLDHLFLWIVICLDRSKKNASYTNK